MKTLRFRLSAVAQSRKKRAIKCHRINWSRADWTHPDAEIARRLEV